MDYNVITAYTPEDLVDRVVDFLDDGWAVQGGICLSYVDKHIMYAQALILHEVE